MEDHINLFYAIKPVYIYQKLFGLIPFSIDLENSKNTIRNSKRNILYTTFVLLAISIIILNFFFVDIQTMNISFFSICDFSLRGLMLTPVVCTLTMNMIRGPQIFNRVINKILLVDEQIWQYDLPRIYRGTRMLLIKVMLIYVVVEYGYLLLDFIVIEYKKGFTNLMYITDIINSAVLLQIVLLYWLLISRFNQIIKRLEEYEPETDRKRLFTKQISFSYGRSKKR